MKEKLEQIKAQALEQIKASDMPEKLNEVRVRFLGKRRADGCIKRNERRSTGRTSKGRPAGE